MRTFKSETIVCLNPTFPTTPDANLSDTRLGLAGVRKDTLGYVPALEFGVFRVAAVGGDAVTSVVLACQCPTAQDPPGQEADLVVRGSTGFGQLRVERPVEQTKLVLNASRTGHLELVRRSHQFTHTKRSFVGHLRMT